MLQERNQGCCDGCYLVRGHVHIVDLILGDYGEVGLVTAADALVEDISVVVKVYVGLCHHLVLLFLCTHVDAALGAHVHLAVLHFSVGSLDEAEIVDPGVYAEGGYQTDVRTLGSLDGAETAVVGVVYVTYLEACPVSGETAGTEG